MIPVVASWGSLGASSLFATSEDELRRLSHVSMNAPIEVRTSTLDDFAREAKIQKAHFLRFDMQGAELPMLKASKDILLKARCLQVEVLPDGTYVGSGPSSVEAFKELLQPLGWRLLFSNVGLEDGGPGHGDALFVRLGQ